MNDIFCLISAIGVDYGVYSYQERFNQLLDSVKSIRKYKPNAYICLMEVSTSCIHENEINILKSTVDQLFVLSEHIFVKDIISKLDSTDTNLMARKTVGELVGMLEFMGWLKQQNKKFDRVFKLSGRHRLNDKFLNINYNKLKGKVVSKKKYWYDRYVYLTQLWSFDYSMLDDIFNIYVKIWDHEINMLSTQMKLDIIETTLYKYFNDYNISVEEITDYIGVEGNHGQDGVEVYE